MTTNQDIHVVGGGIAGLTSALYLARAGRQVVVHERASTLGGRARSRTRDGVIFNLGAHALYDLGEGRAILDELGIEVTGARADGEGALAIHGGAAHALPTGFMTLLTTSLLDLRDKIALGNLMARLPKLPPERYAGRRFDEALDELAARAVVRDVLLAFGRLTTYAPNPGALPAEVVIRQLRLAFAAGVTYLDGGWQAMVDAMAHGAERAGVAIRLESAVDDLGALDGQVVLAVPPDAAGRLLGRRFDVTPIRAACLDLALDGLPRPRRTFALGVDVPTYLSVHSRYAALAPEGTEVVHGLAYGVDGDRGRALIEGTLDLAQPGWRDRVIHERFLPHVTVAHALPGRRPAVDQGEIYLAGDWVGAQGVLADAAFASGREAARLICGGALNEREAA